MKTVIIIGGGISGLTASHELLKLNYNVILLERNDIVGGLARTYQDEKKKICPIEYSWRAYGNYYHNTYNIMKEIPYKNGYVIDNLVPVNTLGKIQNCNNDNNYINQEHTQKLRFQDYIILLPYLFKYLSSCQERNIVNFSPINYRKFLETKHISKKGIDRLGKMIGPFWGMDYNNASLYDIFQTIEMILSNEEKKLSYNITKYPTNYAWFDPWIIYLKKKGLDLRVNNKVSKITIQNGKIQKITVLDKTKKKYSDIYGDYYINCTGPEVLEELLKPYQKNKIIQPLYHNIKNVALHGYQIQMSVYFYLDRQIGLKPGFLYLPNSPWLLIIIPYSKVWGNNHLRQFCKPQIKEVVSVGICQPYEKGLFIKKKWENCTEEEIKIETWYQMVNDSQFKNVLCLEGDITDIQILDFNIWNSYEFNNGYLKTFEPKWSNNVNTIQYRPNSITPVNNLIIGGSYSNTTIGLYSMEGAVESGKNAAVALCKIDNKHHNIILIKKRRSRIFRPFQKIDKLLYTTYYGYNMIIALVIILLIIIIWKKS